MHGYYKGIKRSGGLMQKPILDVCCGGRMWWFDKNDARAVFMDKRTYEGTLCDGRHFEVKPDILGDFTNIPFPGQLLIRQAD